jgi:hypothetical protein
MVAMVVPQGMDGLGPTLVSVATHDRLATLQRMRDRVAEQIDADPCARDLGILVTQLRLLLAEIAELDVGGEVCAADVIAARRAARRGRGAAG